ncbi:MAG TPA: 3-phosphoshikimate 1-carboxyvinyltransferase [Planctomycetaceae bacterium]|nr:3-phosphoshikimate 1-carboxyvinyltransferase [Planctomycetaceae bacterium]
MDDPFPVSPAAGPVQGRVRPPGSKSLTNRALVAAALADGRSRLAGVLDSDDTRVMIESLRRLGVEVRHGTAAAEAIVDGCRGRPPAPAAELCLENSGTSIRFLTAVCTLGSGRFRLDGNARMRQRPIGDLVRALGALGAGAACEGGSDCPPVIVAADGLPGGTARVAGDLSSQFLSALLLAAPCARGPVELRVEGELVSQPYVEMTLGVMSRFGVDIERETTSSGVPSLFRIRPAVYRACDYAIEPDASAASYFFAAAAITGGEVTVEGLSRDSLQGDLAFVRVLEQMGCGVRYEPNAVTVTGGRHGRSGLLRGIDVDMNAISDTAQTLAAVAVFAEGPTRIRNIAHVRHKETDRIAAVASELRRLGIRADEHADGLTIHPGSVQPAVVETYDDHRMAMSFALVGLRVPGIRIADPGCTAKTYPRFWDDLAALSGIAS